MRLYTYWLSLACHFATITTCLGNTPITESERLVSGYPETTDFSSSAAFDTIAFFAKPDFTKDTGYSANNRFLNRIIPEPGAKLNFTQIMFDHGQVTGAEEYLVEVAPDNGSNTFTLLFTSSRDSSPAIMLSNFSFGKNYIWRYAGLSNNKNMGWHGPYGFEIINNPCVDKSRYRVKVLQNDWAASAGGLIMPDMARCIDRNGNFIWFLPMDYYENGAQSGMPFTSSLALEDLRISPIGTVTLLNGTKAEERDLYGNILWSAPAPVDSFGLNNPLPYSYHHTFKRLVSGNYMVLDRGLSGISVPIHKKPVVVFNAGKTSDTAKVEVEYEIVKEFDRNNNQVWSWSSKNYFSTSELSILANERPDPILRNKKPGGHMNAFDVDEKNGFVYIGFRNMDRVVKIEKKSGKVVCAWGKLVNYHGHSNGDGFFHKQHGLSLLHDGSVAVYNDNSNVMQNGNGNAVSSIVVFSQPADAVDSSRLTWEFECRFDSIGTVSLTGGCVTELNNGNLLACMGDVNHIFEVTRAKQVVWDAQIERYDPNDLLWHKFPVANAHYASSLYPCYFTIQISDDTLKGAKNSFMLKIFNAGTENDSYLVSIKSLSGNYARQFSTETVAGKKSAHFEISPERLTAVNDKIEVKVQSKTNPGFKRAYTLQYLK